MYMKKLKEYFFSKGRITRQYAREFEKCMSPEFVDLGIESARAWFQTLTVPIYQRPQFRIVIIFTSLSIVSVIIILACIKRARQRIDLNQEKGEIISGLRIESRSTSNFNLFEFWVQLKF